MNAFHMIDAKIHPHEIHMILLTVTFSSAARTHYATFGGHYREDTQQAPARPVRGLARGPSRQGPAACGPVTNRPYITSAGPVVGEGRPHSTQVASVGRPAGPGRWQ